MVRLIAPVNTVAYGYGMKPDRLTANSWIQAAFRALATGGPQAIRAEAIARDLKVSKGSFYWHFENVAALKSEMLVHWQSLATENVMTTVSAIDGSAEDKLRALVDFATGPAHDPYGGVLTEAAIRDWARYDDGVAATVRAVDVRRLAYLESLFEQNGTQASLCHVHANILYSALIGLEELAHHGLIDLRHDLQHLLNLLLDSRSQETSVPGQED